MSTNLIEAIQKKLGVPRLQKIDPVNHEIKHEEERTADEKLAQAAIPVVLASIYKFTRSEKGRNTILSPEEGKNWLDIILADKEKIAVDKVAHYAGVSEQEAEQNMQLIAEQAITDIRASIANHPTHDAILKFMADQRHAILVHLPAALQLGSLLNDDSMDDRTNKMEGPVSNLMHSIENTFSRGGT